MDDVYSLLARLIWLATTHVLAGLAVLPLLVAEALGSAALSHRTLSLLQGLVSRLSGNRRVLGVTGLALAYVKISLQAAADDMVIRWRVPVCAAGNTGKIT